jgi:hypothetical protein
VRVLGDVGQRFRDEVVGGDLDGLGRPPVELDDHAHRQRGARRERPQRRVQPALAQHGRMDAVGQVAQLAQRGGELLARRRQEPRGLGAGLEPGAERAELERQRDEPLLSAVVEVALQPPPLAVAHLEQDRVTDVLA